MLKVVHAEICGVNGVKWYSLVQSRETSAKYHRRRSDVFIVNFEHISGLVLVFPLLTLNNKFWLGSTCESPNFTILDHTVTCTVKIVIVTAWKVSQYGGFSCPNVGKYRPEKTPYLDTFHAVCYELIRKSKLINFSLFNCFY